MTPPRLHTVLSASLFAVLAACATPRANAPQPLSDLEGFQIESYLPDQEHGIVLFGYMTGDANFALYPNRRSAQAGEFDNCLSGRPLLEGRSAQAGESAVRRVRVRGYLSPANEVDFDGGLISYSAVSNHCLKAQVLLAEEVEFVELGSD